MRLAQVIGPPDGWHELTTFDDAAISNFDNEIVSEIEAALYKGGSYSRHAAWNFNALVWFAEGAWMSQVFVHHAPVASFSAPTLRDLADEHNEEFGWD